MLLNSVLLASALASDPAGSQNVRRVTQTCDQLPVLVRQVTISTTTPSDACRDVPLEPRGRESSSSSSTIPRIVGLTEAALAAHTERQEVIHATRPRMEACGYVRPSRRTNAAPRHRRVSPPASSSPSSISAHPSELSANWRLAQRRGDLPSMFDRPACDRVHVDGIQSNFGGKATNSENLEARQRYLYRLRTQEEGLDEAWCDVMQQNRALPDAVDAARGYDVESTPLSRRLVLEFVDWPRNDARNAVRELQIGLSRHVGELSSRDGTQNSRVDDYHRWWKYTASDEGSAITNFAHRYRAKSKPQSRHLE